jgi:hypothetical protein
MTQSIFSPASGKFFLLKHDILNQFDEFLEYSIRIFICKSIHASALPKMLFPRPGNQFLPFEIHFWSK